MVPPYLINNEQSIEVLHGMWSTMLPIFFYQLLHIDLLDFPLPSQNPAIHQLVASSMHDNHGKIAIFEFSYFFCHSTHVKT